MDYTKKHRENTYSLLMEKWGYSNKSEPIEEVEELEEIFGLSKKEKHQKAMEDEEKKEEEERSVNRERLADLRARDQAKIDKQRASLDSDEPGEHSKKVRSAIFGDNPHGRGDSPEDRAGGWYNEGQELDEMQGHPGKRCDDAHPDEDHEGYMGRISIRLAEASPDKVPKNVETFLDKLERLKTLIATIDDPKEVLSVMFGMIEKIVKYNPTDFNDAEKKRVFLELVKTFRDEVKHVGKSEVDPESKPPTPEADPAAKEELEKVIAQI